MTRTLAESGFPVAAGVTPREFAAAAGASLAMRPETAALSDVPAAVTRAFYRARYGGRKPAGEELARLSGDLDRLQVALRNLPRLARGNSESTT